MAKLPQPFDARVWSQPLAPPTGDFKAIASSLFAPGAKGYVPLPPPPPPQPLERLSLKGLRKRPVSPPVFLVTDLVPAREVTLLPADGGTGKSQLMLQLAVCMALGKPFMGKHCVRSMVVYYSGEDDADVLLYRIKKICDHMNLNDQEMDDLDKWLHVSDRSENPTLFTEFTDKGMGRMFVATDAYKSLQVTIATVCGTSPSIRVSVIVDNASDVFEANENARQEVRRFIRLLKTLARQRDGAVVLLAHLDKASIRDPNGKAQFSGSTAWHNSVRSRLLLVRSEDQNWDLLLTQEKSNHGKGLAAPTRLRWDDAGVLVHVPSDGAAALRLTPDQLRDHILGMVREHYERGQYISASLANNSSKGVWAVLSAHKDFPEQLRVTKGKEALHRLMRRAQSEGRIEVEEVEDPKRRGHKIERWCVVTTGTPAPAVAESEPQEAPQ